MTNTSVALYARVSTLGHGQDPELQLRELREYADRRGWSVVEEYIDRGVSGAKASRPALNRLMEDAQRRKNALESSTLPAKLADCRSTDLDRTELFIVEGDSALGTIWT